MSALDELITRYEESTDSYANASRAELAELRATVAALTARVAELEAAAQLFINADNNDESDWPYSLRDCAMRFHELMPAQASALQPPKAPTEHDAASHQPDAISVIDAAMSRGYTLITETPIDGYGREVLESIKRDIDDNRAAMLEAWHERM